MEDGKALSAMIRKKKKGSLRQDMDYAGQDAVDPNTAWDEKQATEVNEVLGDPDHERPSKKEMGEDESSQSLEARKRISARINKYFESL